jgi:syntaxin 8
MSNPNALLLLADHIKLSLLEQQRAKTLNLPRDSQDGHISRSLDQFREGLEALEREQHRLREAGDERYLPIPAANFFSHPSINLPPAKPTP